MAAHKRSHLLAYESKNRSQICLSANPVPETRSFIDLNFFANCNRNGEKINVNIKIIVNFFYYFIKNYVCNFINDCSRERL